MNEKINILFGQALDKAVPETWTDISPAQLLRFRDAFAELIVLECIDCVKVWRDARDDLMINESHWQGYTHGCDDSIVEIKQRFGVKNEEN